MPRVADFVAIQDHPSKIPPQWGGLPDVHFPLFDAPGASGAPAILTFRLETIGDDVELQASLNGQNLFVEHFKTEPERSWHEVISTPGLVKAEGNDLVIAVRSGTAIVSDVVLFYQAQTSPVAA